MKNLFLLLTLFFSSLFSKDVESVVILGGGIGGLSSAIYLAQAGQNPLVVEKKSLGSALCDSIDVRNWPGEIQITGRELVKKIHRHAEENKVRFLQEEIARVDFSKNPFEIETQNLEGKKTMHYAKSCIIAMGSLPQFLNIPGEKELLGQGVSICTLCDGPLYKNQHVAIVGGGEHALVEAEYLLEIAKKVTIILRDKVFKTHEVERLQKILSHKKLEVLYETQVTSVEKTSGDELNLKLRNVQKKERNLTVKGLFLAIGAIPNSELLKTLQKTKDGYIIVTNGQQTSKKGVFAIGDITNSFCKQAICAAADGAKAALQVLDFLKSQPKTLAKVSKDIKSIPEGKPIAISSEKEFEKEITNSGCPVFVEFYATWCGACQDILPFVSQKADELKGRVKILQVNVDRMPSLAEKYHVTALPTMIMFDSHMQELKRVKGTKDIAHILQEFSQTEANF